MKKLVPFCSCSDQNGIAEGAQTMGVVEIIIARNPVGFPIGTRNEAIHALREVTHYQRTVRWQRAQ